MRSTFIDSPHLRRKKKKKKKKEESNQSCKFANLVTSLEDFFLCFQNFYCLNFFKQLQYNLHVKKKKKKKKKMNS